MLALARLECVCGAAVMAGLTLVGVAAAGAAVIQVPADQPTIQAAVDAAGASGDIIQVAPGIYAEAVVITNKSLTLRGTGGAASTTIRPTGARGLTIAGNSAVAVDGFTFTRNGSTPGGGIAVTGGTVAATNCAFTGCGGTNLSFIGGGAGVSAGGGGTSTFVRCSFTSNTSYNGGGIDVSAGSIVRVEECTFRSNSAPLGGGAMECRSGTFTVVNSLFISNSGNPGGGMAVAVPVHVVGCTFTLNSGQSSSGKAIYNAGGTTTVENCIVWGNTGLGTAIYTTAGAATAVSYSDVQDGNAGTGNLNVDPQWVDPGIGDYHLFPTSPCIDAGNNGASSAFMPFDADGRPRYTDTPGSANVGLVAPFALGVVDMGAFENQPSIGCAADFNHSGQINLQDLFDFLSAWFAGCQ